MHRFIFLLFILSLLLAPPAAHATEATPSDVYAEAVRIEQEVKALKRHLKITATAHAEGKSGDLQPRHVWAKAYVLLLEVSKLRRKLGLSYIEPAGIEPMVDMAPNQPWGMTQRILTELAILRFSLDIPGQAPAPVRVSGKRPIDVYNKLHQISAEMDLMGGEFTSSDVYGQVKRLNEDVNAILRFQRRFEHAVPPLRRDDLLPKDSLHAVFGVIEQIHKIQRAQGLPTMDYGGFAAGDKTTPDDVFSLVAHALMELQRIKAKLGMTHNITPGTPFQENKTPADVVQLLGYIAAKLQFIQAK